MIARSSLSLSFLFGGDGRETEEREKETRTAINLNLVCCIERINFSSGYTDPLLFVKVTKLDANLPQLLYYVF